MPTVARFDGIKIQLFYDEHPPPHFHATFAEHSACFLITTLELSEGRLPRVQLRAVRAWARTRQNELTRAWEHCIADEHPGTIR